MSEIDSQRSTPCPINCGVSQGLILGLILFLLSFNDFESCLKRSKVKNFADDTVVFLLRKIHPEIEQGLNFDLVSISIYFCGNELLINLKLGTIESECYLLRQET